MLVTKTFEFQIKELEAGVSRCEENIRLFQTQVDTQFREKPKLELELVQLKQSLGNLKDDLLEQTKIRILRLEDNIARVEKNIQIYSQEVEKQKELRLQLQLELQGLKISKQKERTHVKK